MTLHNQTTRGWIIFVAAMGLMAGLLSSDIARLSDWEEIRHPGFIAGILGHIATVIAAFVGGKLIPTPSQIVSDKHNTITMSARQNNRETK